MNFNTKMTLCSTILDFQNGLSADEWSSKNYGKLINELTQYEAEMIISELKNGNLKPNAGDKDA